LLLLPFLLNSAAFLGSRLNLDGSFTAKTPENQAVNERSLLATLAYGMIRQRPLTGVGIGAFPEALQAAQPDYPFDYQPPHLVPLEVAAETGLVGAGLYALVLAAPWVLLWRSRARWTTSLHALPLAGLSAALLAIGVVSLLDYYPWLLNPGKLWQWLLWGAWGSAYMKASRR
jgi:O-antigen ligase